MELPDEKHSCLTHTSRVFSTFADLLRYAARHEGGQLHQGGPPNVSSGDTHQGKVPVTSSSVFVVTCGGFYLATFSRLSAHTFDRVNDTADRLNPLTCSFILSPNAEVATSMKQSMRLAMEALLARYRLMRPLLRA